MTDKMANAPKDGTPILILDCHSEFHVVHWDSDLHFGEPFGWTQDGGDRYDPVKWWPLPPPSDDLFDKMRIALAIADDILQRHRIDGLDQNPRGFRDLVGSARIAADDWAKRRAGKA